MLRLRDAGEADSRSCTTSWRTIDGYLYPFKDLTCRNHPSAKAAEKLTLRALMRHWKDATVQPRTTDSRPRDKQRAKSLHRFQAYTKNKQFALRRAVRPYIRAQAGHWGISQMAGYFPYLAFKGVAISKNCEDFFAHLSSPSLLEVSVVLCFGDFKELKAHRREPNAKDTPLGVVGAHGRRMLLDHTCMNRILEKPIKFRKIKNCNQDSPSNCGQQLKPKLE